jgi:hypothetical protein
LCPNKKPFAGEFVREEMEHVCQGVHGARSTKQVIAIGLSQARRAGVDLPPPGKKHHPLARRKEHPRPSLPANAPNPRSAHCVARVLLLPLPPRFPVSHKPAPASAVPQAVIAPPRRLRKPGLTIGTSGAANHQAGARLRFCRGGFTPPSRRAKLSSDSACLAITGLSPEEMVLLFSPVAGT